MQNYEVVINEDFSLSVFETQTFHVIETFFFQDDAEDYAQFLNNGGGFDGWTSKFQYFPNSLNPQEAWNIYTKGYGGGNMLNAYQVQISLLENGTTQSSYTI